MVFGWGNTPIRIAFIDRRIAFIDFLAWLEAQIGVFSAWLEAAAKGGGHADEKNGGGHAGAK